MANSPQLSIIIPFLNEAECLEELVRQLNSFAKNQFDGIPFEVIFVDDGSEDGSAQILDRQKFTGFAARLIQLSRNYGSHAALRAGILEAKAPAVTFLMSDLQDPPEIVKQMFVKMKEGNDIVWARRTHVPGNLFDRAFSSLYAKLMKRFAVKNFPEKGFDVVMFNAKVRVELNQQIERNSSIFLQIIDMGFTQTFIEYERRERKIGRSKWTFWNKAKLLIDSFVAFSYAPIRFVSLLGFSLSICGFLWLIVILVKYVFFRDLSPGWPALIAALMLGFGTTNIALGIIAEYLWRTLDAARNRKTFIVKDTRALGEHL